MHKLDHEKKRHLIKQNKCFHFQASTVETTLQRVHPQESNNIWHMFLCNILEVKNWTNPMRQSSKQIHINKDAKLLVTNKRMMHDYQN